MLQTPIRKDAGLCRGPPILQVPAPGFSKFLRTLLARPAADEGKTGVACSAHEAPRGKPVASTATSKSTAGAPLRVCEADVPTTAKLSLLFPFAASRLRVSSPPKRRPDLREPQTTCRVPPAVRSVSRPDRNAITESSSSRLPRLWRCTRSSGTAALPPMPLVGIERPQQVQQVLADVTKEPGDKDRRHDWRIGHRYIGGSPPHGGLISCKANVFCVLAMDVLGDWRAANLAAEGGVGPYS